MKEFNKNVKKRWQINKITQPNDKIPQ